MNDRAASDSDRKGDSTVGDSASHVDEKEALKALGIDSWQQLSGDKVTKLAGLLPRLERAIALRVVDQIPDFRSVVRELLDTPMQESEATRTANWRSQEHVHQAYRDVRAVLEAELAKENLLPADRLRVLELLLETANRESVKDSENKQFLFGAMTVTAMALISVAGTIAAVVASSRPGPNQRRLDPPSPSGPEGP